MSRRFAALVLLVALAAVGCASVPPPAGPREPAPGRAAAAAPDTIAIRHEVLRPPAPAAALPDTVPSADALAVLAGIPEPLTGAERAARSTVLPAAAAKPAPESAAPETTEEQGGSADVPVPVPTRMLGDRPLPDVAPAAGASGAAPAPTTSAPVPAAPALADSCWRVQFAAWADRARAERYGEAVRSQLGTAVEIEKQAGLFKVRSSDCLDATAADTLRRRARESGFEGAFRFRGARP